MIEPFKSEHLGNGWYTSPDGGMSKIVAPHGIHGGEMVRTIPPQRRVYPCVEQAVEIRYTPGLREILAPYLEGAEDVEPDKGISEELSQ